MIEAIKKLPKLELHCHLDGSVRPKTLYELLLRDGYIEEQSMDDFMKLISVDEENDSLKNYLEKFDWPLKIMQKSEDIERIVYELLEDQSKENIVYTEIRFAPYLHMEKGLSFDEIVDSAIKGVKRGKKDFNIDANLILIAMRHDTKEKSIELVKNGEKYLNKGVVAVDLAGNEADFPPEIHKEAFDLAKEIGYSITIHAGETGIENNILKSIEYLHADRIGHGIAAIKNKEIMDLLAEREIPLEMCPISNLDTKAINSIKEYPIREFINNNIIGTINTDNTTVSNTNINMEYEILVNELDFTMEEIIDLIDNSIDSAFIDDSRKRELKNNLNKFR